MNKQKLNVGSGSDLREDHVNMDLFHPEADLKHDLTKFPWPFLDESFEEVYASHVFEHVPVVIMPDGRDVFLHLMDEAHRVLKLGGRLIIRVPLAGTHTDHSFFQHYRHFTEQTFDVFDPSLFPESWYGTARFHVSSAKRESLGHVRHPLLVHVQKRLPILRPLVEQKTGLRFVLEKM